MGSFYASLNNFLNGPGDPAINEGLLIEGNWYKKRLPTIILLLLFTIIFSIILFVYPEIDINIASVFFLGKHKFLMSDTTLGIFFWKTLPLLMQLSLVLLGSLYLYGELRKKAFLGLTRKRVIFLLLSFLISAALVTNYVFKNHWGRARPYEVTEFSGTKIFTPAWVISNQCKKNCSFISGDASFAFCFISLALLMKRRKKTFIASSITFGTIVGLMRMARGAHFFSDVVLAGCISILIILIFERVFLWKNTSPSLLAMNKLYNKEKKITNNS